MGAIERWDGFLAQIAARHRAVQADAEASGRGFITSLAAGGDPTPLSHHLMAVSNRLQELETMIESTWHAQVDDAIMADGNTVADRDREFDKGRALRRTLDDEREELEPRLFAELARQRFAHAVAQRKGLACSRCGAALQPPFTFRAIDVTCNCGARTPFEPGELMRSVAAIGTHAVAQHAVTPVWRALRKADCMLRDARPPKPLALIQAYEQAQITYWREYLAIRSQFEPELARDPLLEIRSRMEQWYTMHAEFEENWVKAGRPRAI